MKIKTLTVKGFKGISTERSYDLGEKTVALWGKNGEGKTSAVEALRFALTGDAPKNAVFTGQNSAAVQLVTEKDTIGRVITCADGTVSKHAVLNGTKISSKNIDAFLADQTNVPEKNIRILTSDELQRSMDNDMGSFFLPYIRNACRKEDAIKLVRLEAGNSGKAPQKKIDAFLANLPDKITLEDAKALCAEYTEIRREKKIVGKDRTEKRRSVGEQDGTSSAESLQMELDNVNAAMAERRELIMHMNLWQENQAKRHMVLAKIDELKVQMEKIAVDEAGADDAEALKEQKEQLRGEIDELVSRQSKLHTDRSWMQKMLDELSTGACPISRMSNGTTRIVCTTNLSEILEKVRADLEKTETEYNTAQQQLDQCRKQLDLTEQRIAELHETRMLRQQKMMLKEQIDTLMEALPEDMEKPQEDVEDYEGMKKDLETRIQKAKNYQEAAALTGEINELAGDVYALDVLVKAFSPKGIVYESLLSMYAETLTKAANILQDHTGLKVRFVNDDGFKCQFITENTDWRTYELLSTGEKLMASFMVANLCNSLSGLGIMIIDNLDSLDDDNLDRFLTIIDKSAKDYDNIIIAGVDHAGTADILKKHGIKII